LLADTKEQHGGGKKQVFLPGEITNVGLNRSGFKGRQFFTNVYPIMKILRLRHGGTH
jgi:hypothetical protein